MVVESDTEATLLMAILQEPNAEKARQQYKAAFNLDEIDDQAFTS